MDGTGGRLQLRFMVRVEGRKSTRLSVAASTGLFAFDIQERPCAWQHRMSLAWGESFIDRQGSQMITEICQPVNSGSREVVSRRSYHCLEAGATRPPHIYLRRYLEVVAVWRLTLRLPPPNDPTCRIESTVIAEWISDASSSKEVPARHSDPPALDATEHLRRSRYIRSPASSRLR